VDYYPTSLIRRLFHEVDQHTTLWLTVSTLRTQP
jgi:hypothetical protein